MNLKIAILITCYNRLEKTKECLKHCFNSLSLIDNFDHDIFLLDDNSPDKTGEIIKKMYPSINVIYGNGKYFWSGGTRKLWELASTKKNYDYYVWLNDDSILSKNAFSVIYNDLKKKSSSIIIGTFVSSNQNLNELTYGGRDKNLSLLTPSGEPQECSFINGNFVLVSKKNFDTVGYLNNKYTHSLGDIDYGLRAIQNGIKLYCTSKCVGRCKANNFIWYNEKNVINRLKAFNSPKGTPLNEYIYFNYYHFGVFNVLKFLVASFFALLFPKFYKLLRTQ